MVHTAETHLGNTNMMLSAFVHFNLYSEDKLSQSSEDVFKYMTLHWISCFSYLVAFLHFEFTCLQQFSACMHSYMRTAEPPLGNENGRF